MSEELQLIKLSEDHVEQVNQFLRNNAFTEPVIATFNGEKSVEGTVLEEWNKTHVNYFFQVSPRGESDQLIVFFNFSLNG